MRTSCHRARCMWPTVLTLFDAACIPSTKVPMCYPKPFYRSGTFLSSTMSSTGSLKPVLWVGFPPSLQHSTFSFCIPLTHGLTLLDILLIVPPIFHSAISDHLSENYLTSSHRRARIELRRHSDGEKEEDEEKSESTGGAVGLSREGTARLLRRFKSSIRVSYL